MAVRQASSVTGRDISDISWDDLLHSRGNGGFPFKFPFPFDTELKVRDVADATGRNITDGTV